MFKVKKYIDQVNKYCHGTLANNCKCAVQCSLFKKK